MVKMNKDRLKLCRSFTESKTIAQLDKEANDLYWQRLREVREMSVKAQRLIRAMAYQNRPWYKKIFD